jgi:hypothetical protein
MVASSQIASGELADPAWRVGTLVNLPGDAYPSQGHPKLIADG